MSDHHFPIITIFCLVVVIHLLIFDITLRKLSCSLGFHRWRKVFRRNQRFFIGNVPCEWHSQLYGEFYLRAHRCKWCGKEKCL